MLPQILQISYYFRNYSPERLGLIRRKGCVLPFGAPGSLFAAVLGRKMAGAPGQARPAGDLVAKIGVFP